VIRSPRTAPGGSLPASLDWRQTGPAQGYWALKWLRVRAGGRVGKPTGGKCCSVAVLQCCSVAVLQCCSVAVLQCCSVAVESSGWLQGSGGGPGRAGLGADGDGLPGRPDRPHGFICLRSRRARQKSVVTSKGWKKQKTFVWIKTIPQPKNRLKGKHHEHRSKH
jgi:hypothetical protein